MFFSCKNLCRLQLRRQAWKSVVWCFFFPPSANLCNFYTGETLLNLKLHSYKSKKTCSFQSNCPLPQLCFINQQCDKWFCNSLLVGAYIVCLQGNILQALNTNCASSIPLSHLLQIDFLLRIKTENSWSGPTCCHKSVQSVFMWSDMNCVRWIRSRCV